jgi:hypothetical protein
VIKDVINNRIHNIFVPKRLAPLVQTNKPTDYSKSILKLYSWQCRQEIPVFYENQRFIIEFKKPDIKHYLDSAESDTQTQAYSFKAHFNTVRPSKPTPSKLPLLFDVFFRVCYKFERSCSPNARSHVRVSTTFYKNAFYYRHTYTESMDLS